MYSGRLHALLLLSWALLRSLAKKLFGAGPRGLALLEANYAADKLSSVTPAEREQAPERSACIACGKCDAGDGERMASSLGAYPGTMALMLAASRSMPDFAAALEAFDLVTDDELAEKEAACPTRVPMRRVAAFVRAHAGRALS